MRPSLSLSQQWYFKIKADPPPLNASTQARLLHYLRFRWRRLLAVISRVRRDSKLMLRYLRDIASLAGWRFWVIFAIRAIQSVKAPGKLSEATCTNQAADQIRMQVTLHLMDSLIRICGEISEGVPLDRQRLVRVASTQVALNATLEALSRVVCGWIFG